MAANGTEELQPLNGDPVRKLSCGNRPINKNDNTNTYLDKNEEDLALTIPENTEDPRNIIQKHFEQGGRWPPKPLRPRPPPQPRPKPHPADDIEDATKFGIETNGTTSGLDGEGGGHWPPKNPRPRPPKPDREPKPTPNPRPKSKSQQMGNRLKECGNNFDWVLLEALTVGIKPTLPPGIEAEYAGRHPQLPGTKDLGAGYSASEARQEAFSDNRPKTNGINCGSERPGRGSEGVGDH